MKNGAQITANSAGHRQHAQAKELAKSIPGEYFIFSLATGHRLDIKPDDLDASSETKKKLPASESKEGPHAQLRPDLQSMQ
jgi:hypothetical protein